MLRNAPTLALHAAASASLALCAGLPIGSGADGAEVPDWVMILPAGTFSGADGRGPYHVADAQALVDASIKAMNGSGLIDENHATDLAAPKGEPAPARGWIRQLQARADGIWARIEWTKAGRDLLADRAYRHISPAFMHRKDGTITEILRASLVNDPNLRGIAALHAASQEKQNMDLLAQLVEALGLDSTTTADQLVETVKTLHAKQDETSRKALAAAVSPIALAAGLPETADAAAVRAGVEKLAAAAATGAGEDSVKALQAELKTVTEKLNSVTEATAREKAVAFVDGAIRAGRVGVKPLRDHYVARHMVDAAAVEKEIGSFPTLSGDRVVAPAPQDGTVALNAAQRDTARMLGIDPKKYEQTLAAEREQETAR